MSGARAVTFVPLKPKEHILACDAIVAWEPSVFGGDGSETRLNIVLTRQKMCVAFCAASRQMQLSNARFAHSSTENQSR